MRTYRFADAGRSYIVDEREKASVSRHFGEAHQPKAFLKRLLRSRPLPSSSLPTRTVQEQHEPLALVADDVLDLLVARLHVRHDERLDEVLILLVELQVVLELARLQPGRPPRLFHAELAPQLLARRVAEQPRREQEHVAPGLQRLRPRPSPHPRPHPYPPAGRHPAAAGTGSRRRPRPSAPRSPNAPGRPARETGARWLEGGIAPSARSSDSRNTGGRG